jgi:hypothetical protein
MARQPGNRRRGSTVMMTARLRRLSVDRHTSPMPPAPICAVTSYGPRRVPGSRANPAGGYGDTTSRAGLLLGNGQVFRNPHEPLRGGRTQETGEAARGVSEGPERPAVTGGRPSGFRRAAAWRGDLVVPPRQARRLRTRPSSSPAARRRTARCRSSDASRPARSASARCAGSRRPARSSRRCTVGRPR